jgi:major capsid protein gp7
VAVTLVQAAARSPNMLQRGVIETFIDESPVLARIPFMEIEGNAYQYSQEASLPGVAFRSVNEAYTESTGAVNNFTEGLKILGGEAYVDRFIQQTMSNFDDQRALQLRLKVKAEAIKFTETFFEGDVAVDTKSFDGLRKRLTGAQVITAATNGAALTLDMVDDLFAAVVGGPDIAYADAWVIRKINRLRRAAGIAELDTIELAGRIVPVYAGVPIVDTGTGLDGTTRILGFDETVGTSNITASMYAVKWGEQEYVSGLQNGDVMVDDLGLLESKPSYAHRVEWYVGLAIFNGKAAARLKGILQT